MAHKNTGDLLDAFRVQHPNDYHKLPPKDKSLFISQLYSSITLDAQLALKELKDKKKYNTGLKLHFHAKHVSSSGYPHNVPSEIFIRKMAFFADTTIISYPFHDFTESDLTKSDLIDVDDFVLFGKYSTSRSGYGGGG